MEKALLFFSAALMAAAASFAQPVIKQQTTYGGTGDDILVAMCVTKDSGLIIGGYSGSPVSGNKTTANVGACDMWILKQDKTGKKKWEKTIGGSGDDILTDIKATTDGGYIITGYSNSNISGKKTENSKGDYDYWIVKVDNIGRMQWDKTLGGTKNDRAYSIEQTPDGGYIVAGSSYSQATGDKTENTVGGSDIYTDSDIWLLKLDNNGTIQWQNTIGGIADEGMIRDVSFAHDGQNRHLMVVKQSPDGGYIVGTSSNSNTSGDKTGDKRGYSDYWVVKTDNVGNVVWDRTIGGNGEDFLSTLAPTADGGYMAGGYSYSSISGEKTADKKVCDYWIIKLNGAGAIQWDKTIGGASVDILQNMKLTADGGFLLAGNSTSGKSGDKSAPNKGMEDYWILKLNSSGAKEWDKTIGGANHDYPYDVEEISPNTYYVGGASWSDISGAKKQNSFGVSDFWVIKLADNNAPFAPEIITSSKLNNNESADTKLFSVYPNPATTILHIQNVGKATFILSDQGGKRMLSKTMEGNGELNVANIPAGSYYLTNTTTNTTQKVIITK